MQYVFFGQVSNDTLKVVDSHNCSEQGLPMRSTLFDVGLLYVCVQRLQLQYHHLVFEKTPHCKLVNLLPFPQLLTSNVPDSSLLKTRQCSNANKTQGCIAAGVVASQKELESMPVRWFVVPF